MTTKPHVSPCLAPSQQRTIITFHEYSIEAANTRWAEGYNFCLYLNKYNLLRMSKTPSELHELRTAVESRGQQQAQSQPALKLGTEFVNQVCISDTITEAQWGTAPDVIWEGIYLALIAVTDNEASNEVKEQPFTGKLTGCRNVTDVINIQVSIILLTACAHVGMIWNFMTDNLILIRPQLEIGTTIRCTAYRGLPRTDMMPPQGKVSLMRDLKLDKFAENQRARHSPMVIKGTISTVVNGTSVDARPGWRDRTQQAWIQTTPWFPVQPGGKLG
ncbi:hypothetical protein DFJ58DRAFT_916989 [Suillus subalutaceus]|uniref:uncharacterized protein n=1 Tax=Suillus subalutaceus TaxID=48586 RepID=UPI001B87253A|nr:uncharacterized protein DFJ58DRAFT_916989 [Suillus subalutaceus]KAG1839316.1 hypothetical protein DFJ58DRAFT_916989 [Suillus subalutaceus]